MIAAAVIAPVASTGPGVPDTLRWPMTFPHAYASDERTTASVPATPHQPPSGCAAGEHADADQPEREAEQLAARERLVREEAEPEEDREERHRRLRDRRDPRVDVLLAPGDEPERDARSRPRRCTTHWRHDARSSAIVRRTPQRPQDVREEHVAAIAARAHISGAGSSPPSTATLMKRYDAPQTDASRSSSGQ